MSYSYLASEEKDSLMQDCDNLSDASSEVGKIYGEKDSFGKSAPASRRAFRLVTIIGVINIIVLAVSIGVGTWSYVSLTRLRGNVDNALYKKTSFYCTYTPYSNPLSDSLDSS